MLLVKSHAISGIIAPIGFATNFATDGYLCSKAHDSDTDLVVDKRSDCLVNITWVRGKEGAKNDKDLTGAMAWSMAVA